MEAKLINHMGDELTIVNAARVSFAKESEWIETGGKVLQEKDRKLINYLAIKNHWTPFGHCMLQFHVKAPIFVARQLVKHQIGLVWNEVSRRYVSDTPELYWPDKWRKANPDKKQGSYEDQFVDLGSITHYSDYDGGNIGLDECLDDTLTDLVKMYEKMIDNGVAPEQARMILPQNMYTEWYWTGSLMAFARICNLRLYPDAQYETRLVCEDFYHSIRPLFPNAWPMLTENVKLSTDISNE